MKTKAPIYSVGGFFKGTPTSAVEVTGTGGGAAGSWDQIYDLDQSMTIDDATMSFALTNATADGVTLTATSNASGDCLHFANAGSGNDVHGTSDTWGVTKAGAATFVSVTVPTLTLGSGAAAGTVSSNGNFDVILTTGNATSSILTITDGANGAATFTMNGTGSVVIAGTTEGNASLTVTNGDVSVADGSLTIVDDDNASSFAVTNASLTTADATTITAAALTTGNALLITTNAMTSGNGVKVVSSVAGLTTGRYFTAWDSAERFGVYADGATKITSATATTKSLEITGIQTSEDLATLTSTGATAATKGVLKVVQTTGVLAGAVGMFTTSSASAAASAVLLVTHTGTPAAATSYLAHFDNTGATMTNNPITVQISSLTSAGSALKITSTATATTLGVMAMVNAEMTTGTGFYMGGMTAITTGKGIDVTATTTLTSGILMNIVAAGTALTGAGRFLFVNHTGAATAATTAKIVEFASAAADDTEIFKVTASAALAAGMAVNISAASMTTGVGLSIKDLNALTTGSAIVVASNSADATARNLVSITNTHASAVAAIPLYVTNGSTGDIVSIVTTGVLGAAKAGLQVYNNVSSLNATASLIRAHQDKTDGVAFCMTLQQDDLDVAFINFVGTAAADSNSNISTHGTGTVTDFVRCAINGTAAWIPVVTGALSA